MIELRFQPGDEPVPGYMLTKFLGAGNFGEVWEARGPGGVLAAMKILSEIDRRSGRTAFKALQLVKNLPHLHLVKIYGFWLKDDQGQILDDEVDPNFSDDSVSSWISPPVDDTPEDEPRQTMGVDDFFGTDGPRTSTDQGTDGPDGPVGTIIETPNTGNSPAQLVIAMGLAEETLEHRLKRHQKQRGAGRQSTGKTDLSNGIPREELLRFMTGAAKGLDFLNLTHKIEHGDVKPANIMIIGGEAQLSDFDLARDADDIRGTKALGGSPAYSAPELSSPTSDQYALAVTYYEMRTGELPYRKATRREVDRAKLTGDLFLDRLPKRERAVIRRATSVNPAARYPSCAAMVEALSHEPIKWGKVIGSLAGAVLILAGIIGGWEYSGITPKPSELVQRIISPRIEPHERLVETKEYKDIEKLLAELNGLPDDPMSAISAAQISTIGTARDRIDTLARRPYTPPEYDLLRVPNQWLCDFVSSHVPQMLNGEIESAQQCIEKFVTSSLEPTNIWEKIESDKQKLEAWRISFRLARCRAHLIMAQDSASDGDDFTHLPPLDDSSWSGHAQESGLYALHASRNRKSQPDDVLSRSVLEPTAKLLEHDPEMKKLATWEKEQLEDLKRDIFGQYQAKSKTRKFATDEIAWLETITGIKDIKILNILVEALEYIDSNKFGDARKKIESARSTAGELALAPDSESVLSIDEVDLLLCLRDTTADPTKLLPSLVKLLDRKNSLCEKSDLLGALMMRAQSQVLQGGEEASAAPAPRLDITATSEALQKIQSLNLDLGEHSTSEYLAWWDGIRAADSVFRPEVEYPDWKELCDRFRSGTGRISQIDKTLRDLVEICAVECLVQSHLSEPDWRLPDDQKQPLNDALDRLLPNPPERYRTYIRFADCVRNYDKSLVALSGQPDSLLKASEDFVGAVETLSQNPSRTGDLDLFDSRTDRLRLCQKVFLRAVKSTLPTQEVSVSLESPDELRDPFPPGGAGRIYRILQLLYGRLTEQAEYIEYYDLLAQAAYYHAQELRTADPQRFSVVIDRCIEAAEVCRTLLNADDPESAKQLSADQKRQLVRDYLIASRAYRDRNREGDFEAACARSAHLARLFTDNNFRAQAQIKSDSFLKNVLQPAIEAIAAAPLGKQIEKLQGASRALLASATADTSTEPQAPQLTGVTDSLSHDIARIYAAQGFYFRDYADLDSAGGDQDADVTAFVSYDVASKLAPSEDDFLVQMALRFRSAFTAASGDRSTSPPAAVEVQFLRRVINRPESGSSASPDRENNLSFLKLKARYHLLEARLTSDANAKQVSLQQAVDTYDKARKIASPNETDEPISQVPAPSPLPIENREASGGTDRSLADLLVGAATSRVELANLLAALPDREAQNAKIDELLSGAISYAERASHLTNKVELQALIHLVWGNALEDQALLLNDLPKYGDAIVEFEKVIESLSTSHKVANNDLYQGYLSKARATYRQLDAKTNAFTHPTQSTLNDLNNVLSVLSLADNEQYATLVTRVEATYYQGMVYQQLGLVKVRTNRSDLAFRADLVTSERLIEEAVTLARENQLPEVFWGDYQLSWMAAVSFLLGTTSDSSEVPRLNSKLIRLSRELIEVQVLTDPHSNRVSDDLLPRSSAWRCVQSLQKLMKAYAFFPRNPTLNSSPGERNGLKSAVVELESSLRSRIADVDVDIQAFAALMCVRFLQEDVPDDSTQGGHHGILQQANSILDSAIHSVCGKSGDKEGIWCARLKGQQALVMWSKLGALRGDVTRRLDAVRAGQEAIKHIQVSNDLFRTERLYLSLRCVNCILEILKDRSIPVNERQQLWNIAEGVFREISGAHRVWNERGDALRSFSEVSLEHWDWGMDERRHFLEDNELVNVSEKIRDIRRALDAAR